MANEPDLTQRLTVTFENTTQPIDAEFGVISQIENGKVLYGTTEHWNSTPELVAREGWLYIYSDYKQDEQGNDIAGTKVGDGTTLLSALPFTDKLLYLHVDDSTRHITQAERELWNKSVNALHWLGITTTELTDGASTNPITIDGDSVTAVDGDIVSYNSKEFVFNGSVWQEFGDLSDVYTKSQVDTLLADKMNKDNPVGTGSFSMNRKPDTTVGTGSATVGDGNTASGNYTFAEGFANTASGTCAHAEGNVVQSTGAFSHAEGQYSIANNKCAHAEGYRTKSSGSLASHAEGSYTTASEHSAHAEGYTTVASGQYSHAEGRETTASAFATHTEGLHTTASNNYAHAEGCATSASNVASHAEGYETTASGQYAHAEGQRTVASGTYSHAEGCDTTASGTYSHAEGDYTVASGARSHAEGYGNTASGEYSHAEGHHTIANHSSQHVFGKYNIPDDSEEPATSEGNYVEIVGNGYFDYEEEEAIRSNARTLDWDGNEMIAGDLTYNGSTSLTSAISDVNTRIDNLPEPMIFKGSLGTGGTITALPVDGSADRGWTYKVIEAGTYAGQSADIGDTFICDSKTADANTWTLIPSGDEPSGTVTSIQIQASSPINIDNSTAITTSGTRTISHANSGATAGDYGDSSAQTPAVGSTFKVPYVSVNATGHITNINAHNVTMPIPTATDVTYDNTTSGLSATTTQSAIDEIKSETYTKTEVDTLIRNLPEPMIFKGTLGVGGTITELPTASTSNEGYTYKVITEGTYAGTSAKVGDVFVSSGSAWVLIPAGDEDNDTWRAIKVNGTEKLGNAISSGSVDFVDTANVKFEFDSNGNAVKATLSGIDTSSEVDAKVAALIDDTSTVNNKAWSSEKTNAELAALLPVDEASGAIANFDTDVVLPLIDVKAEIKAVETGTGAKSPSNPYVISGVSAVSVYQSGANLWDEEWELGMYSTSTGAKESASTVIRCKNPIAVKGGNNYYFKNSGVGVAFQIYKYDSNMNYLGYISYGSGVKNLESGVAFITFNLNTTYGTTYNNNLSINLSTDTDYHAYNPNSNVTLINLGGTYYGGYVKQDKDGKRELVDTYSNLVNLPDLTFYPTTKGGHICFYADLPNGVIKSGGEQAFSGKCSTYTVTSNLTMPNDLTCLFYCSELYGGYTRILIRDDSASTMTGAQFAAYVTGQTVYEKASPQTIDLSDGELITAFNGVNNVWSDTNGDTTVKYKLGIQAYIDKKIAEVQALVL